jgi:hypothetical protein
VRILNSDKKKEASNDSKFGKNTSFRKNSKLNIVKADEKCQYEFKDTRTECIRKERAMNYEMFLVRTLALDIRPFVSITISCSMDKV